MPTTPETVTDAQRARLHRYKQEAARKFDRARDCYMRQLIGTGRYDTRQAQALWLELLRAEVAVTVQVVSQGMLFPSFQFDRRARRD
jgi:hypothetical protein